MDYKYELTVIPVSDVDRGTFMSLKGPDGNTWLIQEVRQRAPGR